MSELTNMSSGKNFRVNLLTTVSAFALTVTLSGSAMAADRPSVWIELGGQLERLGGAQGSFLPPFTQVSSGQSPYTPVSPAEAQKPSIYSYGGEGKFSFSPADSNWVFSASVRYGRSNAKKRLHQQSAEIREFPLFGTQIPVTGNVFADYQTSTEESHAILDFTAGREVGLGALGVSGSSTLSAGVRFANFNSHATSRIIAQPENEWHDAVFIIFPISVPNHHNYTAIAHASRSFQGFGPSLSWDASLSVAGEPDTGSLTVDWGLSGALLFGRQKAVGDHSVNAQSYIRANLGATIAVQPDYYHQTPHNRRRSVIVPNIGGFAGVSMRYPSAKVSFGYRADFFFNAVDVGLDARHSADRNFYGPFASVSIGLGE